ncbi:MAG: adenylate kinase [Acidobacteria bacterium]|nr:adenylate kinase [Acidobacteriota bacterium]
MLVFLGPPGAGKGTQARVISKELGIPHISTGDILREAVRKETSLGLAAKAKMDRGDLVPDDVISGIVEERIGEPDCREGAILDGFPRTIAQAQFLDQVLQRSGRNNVLLLNLQLDPKVVIKRLAGRRTCSKCGEIYNIYFNPPRQEGICDKDGGPLVQRKDDNEETIRQRLLAYEQETVPLIEYYRRKNALHDINGNGEPEAITERLLGILKNA